MPARASQRPQDAQQRAPRGNTPPRPPRPAQGRSVPLLTAWGRHYRYAPEAFANSVVPWGQPGPYRDWSGLWPWQRTFFAELGRQLAEASWGEKPAGGAPRREPVQWSVSSCADSGKTALVQPLLVLWVMAAYPGTRVMFVSSTEDQAKKRFYPNLKLLVDSSPKLTRMFGYTEAGVIYRRDQPNATYCTVQTAGRGTTGMHSPDQRTAIVIDEANLISDRDFGYLSSPMSDAYSMVFAFGNPTEPDGWHWETHSGGQSKDWRQVFIDARTLPTWNAEPAAVERMERRYDGRDSWRYRAYVLGLPPIEGVHTMVPMQLAELASERPLEDEAGKPVVDYGREPVVVGLDLARVGRNKTTAVWRAGIDARTVEPESYRGSDLGPDELINWAVDIATRPRPPFGAPAVVYYDATGESGQFHRNLERAGVGHVFQPVVMSHADPTKAHAHLRDALWTGMKVWLQEGGCIRPERGLVRTIASARVGMRQNRVKVEEKSKIARRVGREWMDEVDALTLACRQPPLRWVMRNAQRAAMPRRVPRPEGLGYGA